MNGIDTKWMDWEDLMKYQDQLIELEMVLIQKYHYPNMKIPISYCINSVKKLEVYLKEGCTFFWGATKNMELVGYYWAYITEFINKKRWILRSLMIREDYQQKGLGSMAMQEGIAKAIELNCNEMSTEYVPWNSDAAQLYGKYGYQISRIEVVKTLEK